MLSHDLARMLLERRNNDVAIAVITDIKGEPAPSGVLIRLRDSDEDAEPGEVMDSKDIVSYNSLADFIVIYAGRVSFGYDGTED